MGEALAEFSQWADPEGKKVLVFWVDNAGGHVAKVLKVPANLRLIRCTPELQPAEHGGCWCARRWPIGTSIIWLGWRPNCAAAATG